MPTQTRQGAPSCAPTSRARLAIVLVLDRSRSMDRHREEMLGAVARLERDIVSVPERAATVEMAKIAFGPPEIIEEFRPVGESGTTYLGASEAGPVGPAMALALELADRRRRELPALGVRAVYRPLIVLVSDGRAETDESSHIASIRRAFETRSVACLPLVPAGVDPQVLAVWGSREPLALADAAGAWPRTIEHYLRLPARSPRRDPVVSVPAPPSSVFAV